MSKRLIGSLVFSALIVCAVVAAAFNVQLIKDSFVYYQFTPDHEIVEFVDQSGMNDRGKFLFYASQPSLMNAASFNQLCEKHDTTAAILGCYDGERIYIYNITDPRLAGIRPTTAAHEMLHAAYMRLNDNDKRMVNRLLEVEYQKLKNDQELAGRMAFYEVSQPGEQDNELHSIIATEVAEVSPELENYFSRYFSDRSKVIAQHKQYSSLFEELRVRAAELNSQISSLAQQMEQERATYEANSAVLERDISSFNTKADGGGFTSQAAFNAERRVLMARSATLDRLREKINTTINEYNSLIQELNAVAIETNTLNKSIDSGVEPVPSL